MDDQLTDAGQRVPCMRSLGPEMPCWVAIVPAISVAILVIMTAVQPAAAETRPTYGGSLTASLLGEPATLDPARAASHAELTLVSLLFDTLYRIDGKDPDGQLRIVPHLAAALPEVDDSGLEARIALRSGILFHDGRALTAGDVARSLIRVKRIRNGGILASVRSVRADGSDVVIRFVWATPPIAVILAAPTTAVTPRGRAPSWRKPARFIGSGPYRLVRFRRAARRIHLAAADRHFAGRPYIDDIILRWFGRAEEEATEYEAGRAHMSLRGAVAFAGHKPAFRTRALMGPATILAYIGFGKTPSHHSITYSRGFRRALSLAIDRNGFRGVGTGERVTIAEHPVSPAMGGQPTPAPVRSARLPAAQASLAQAARSVPLLAEIRSGQRPVELELIIDRMRPDDREIAEKVLAALFRLGIAARITQLDSARFSDRVARGACDLYIGQLAFPLPRADFAIAAAFAAGGDTWAGEILARGPLDIETAGREFARRLPIVPLFHRALRVHHRTDVHGLRLDDTSIVPLDDLFLFGRAERTP